MSWSSILSRPPKEMKSSLDYFNNKEDQKNMSNKIGEVAKDFKSNATKNIADLPEVSTELEVFDDQFEITDKKTNQPKTVKQKIIRVGESNYRVPSSVFQQLKIVLEDNPNLKKFKVKKSGEGIDGTRYQVIPLV